MFRLIRLVILMALAFTAGVLMERNHGREMCAVFEGSWVDGVCLTSGAPNG